MKKKIEYHSSISGVHSTHTNVRLALVNGTNQSETIRKEKIHCQNGDLSSTLARPFPSLSLCSLPKSLFRLLPNGQNQPFKVLISGQVWNNFYDNKTIAHNIQSNYAAPTGTDFLQWPLENSECEMCDPLLTEKNLKNTKSGFPLVNETNFFL